MHDPRLRTDALPPGDAQKGEGVTGQGTTRNDTPTLYAVDPYTLFMTPKPVVLFSLLFPFLVATAHAQESRFTVRALGLRSDLSRMISLSAVGTPPRPPRKPMPGRLVPGVPAVALDRFRSHRDPVGARPALPDHFNTPTGPRLVNEFSQTVRFQINTLGLAVTRSRAGAGISGSALRRPGAIHEGGDSLNGFAWGGAATFEWPLGPGVGSRRPGALSQRREAQRLGSPEQTFEMWWTAPDLLALGAAVGRDRPEPSSRA